ncbi:twin-arginine translocation signal domain-containing protein [Haloterrigena salinisoli]|uniref:twin-arginine translocation signal domain-containing protein n=1 Tax=Haloterrigena salinisoli TaxID=3132747 RepID=UPI0030D0D2DA
MPTHPSSVPSRRRFLGVAAGTVATVATAGCLGALAGGSSGMTRIESEDPSEPREGSPGEFYYFLEENDVAVDELLRDGDELYLTYRSGAETVEESDEEITIVYEIYKRALIQRGSSVEFLYAEISNPFDGQAVGWGINTEWIRKYDGPDGDGSSDESSIADDVESEPGNESNESAGNETDGSGNVDMGQVTLWNNIMNSKVYESDLEDGEAESDLDNGTEADANDSDEN